MDQKNTIVKCTANPNCLFNHNGICDNYVITIGADGSCQEYIETATEEDMKNGVIGKFGGYSITKPDKPIILKETKRCDLFDDTFDEEYEALFNATKNMLKSAGVEIKQEDQMCWYCDHGKHGKCTFLVKPMRDPKGECCRFTSTGGNR